MTAGGTTSAFEAAIVPWLDAGYNLARWLLRDEAQAEDAVQEAVLRALRYFHALRGGEARAWFLGIVRNTCFTHLAQRRDGREQNGLEDDHLEVLQWSAGLVSQDPALLVEQSQGRGRVDAAIRALSPPLREVLVLRELEELDYAEIAQVVGIPIGTVMSRLSRARAQLKMRLSPTGQAGRS